MDITVTGRDFEVTQAIREHATDKASKLTRFFDRISQVEVVLGRHDNHTYDAELIAHVDGHDHFVAHGRNEDLYAAIADAEHKIERQLRDHKNRVVDHHSG